jgi:hypothetical protein
MILYFLSLPPVAFSESRIWLKQLLIHLPCNLYQGWLNNSKKNGVPTYKIDPNAKPGTTGNLFDNTFTSGGLFNSYINVCGNDDSTSTLDKAHSPADMKNLDDNILSASDVSNDHCSRLYFPLPLYVCEGIRHS